MAKFGDAVRRSNEKKPVQVQAGSQGPVDRGNRNMLSAWVSSEGKRYMRIIAAEEGRKMQDVVLEAVNDFLEKKGKPRVA